MREDERGSLVNLLLSHLARPDLEPGLAALLASSVVNMGGGKSPQIVRALVPTLEALWRFDGLHSLLELAHLIQQQQQPATKEEAWKSSVEAVRTKWRPKMSAQRSAFEILTNICSSLEEVAEPSMGDGGEGEEDQDGMIEDEAAAVAAAAEGVNMDEAAAIPPELLASLPLQDILAAVVAKAKWDRAKVAELAQAFDFMAPCATDFHTVQARALSCLNNMLLVLPLPADKQQADGLWALLLGLCIEASQPPPPPLGNEANFETLELVTASMWTLLRKSAQSGSPLLPQANVVDGMVQLAASGPSFTIRTNAIGCLGIMGQQSQLVNLSPKVAAVLVHSVATSLASQPVPQHPWWSEHATVVAEGLNGLFDMFSEEDKDHVFVQLDLLPKLRAFSPLIRTKLRQEGRRLDRGLRERLQETKLNLDRFIQYKAARLPPK